MAGLLLPVVGCSRGMKNFTHVFWQYRVDGSMKIWKHNQNLITTPTFRSSLMGLLHKKLGIISKQVCSNLADSFFIIEGPRSRCYGRTAAFKAYCATLWGRWWRFFLLFHFNGAPVKWNWQEKTKVLGEKPVPVPLCPPQIPHGATQDFFPLWSILYS